MQYLIVILDESANSFCYYPNPNREHRLMDLDVLKKGIFFAQKEGWLINFLVGKTTLPKEYTETIDVINHILITPPEYPQDCVEDVLVIDCDLCKSFENIPNNPDKNIILRMDKNDLYELSNIVISLQGKYKRINVALQHIDLMTDNDFAVYQEQLTLLSKWYLEQPKGADAVEISVLADRLFFQNMNNCDAGVKHLTLAPNGKFYICPAFYYEDETNDCGNLETGLRVKNKQLLQLNHAPLCRKCDAYQCKRCVWMNRKTTLEVNTPSHEQCVVSHLERNASRMLLSEIRKIGNFLPDMEIKEIDYLDPFDVRKEI